MSDTNLDEELFKDYRLQNEKLDEQENVVVGQERFNPNTFRLMYTTFRLNHLTSRILELDKRIQYPVNSIVHIFDDLNHLDDHSDTPRLDEHPLIMRESLGRVLMHVTDLSYSPITFNERFIYRKVGLPANLMKFRSQNSRLFRFVVSTGNIPKGSYLTVFNYNPLFRTYVLGAKLNFFRRVNFILANILNNALDIYKKFPEKNHFIEIPWTDEVYQRALFIRSVNKWDLSTIKKPNELGYILRVQLLNYFWDGDSLSYFKQLPEDFISKITLVLHNRDKYCFLNLKEIKDLNKNNKIIFRLVNYFNLLSLLGRPPEDKTAIEHQEILKEYLESKKVEITTKSAEETVNEEQGTPNDDKLFDPKELNKIIDGLSPRGFNKQDYIKPISRVIDIKDSALRKMPGDSDDRKMESLIANLDKLIPRRYIKDGATATPKLPIGQNIVQEVKEGKPQKPVVITVGNETNVVEAAQVDTFTPEYNEIQDTKAIQLIEADFDLTPRQKQRYIKLSQAYRDLTLEGTKIEKLLYSDSSTSLLETKLGDNVVGENPIDESIRESSIQNLDTEYMKHSYKKHLAGILTSFRSNGVFLTGLKEEKHQTPLNNDKIYTCTYMDIKGRQSTIKFRVPTLDRHGRLKVSGVEKAIIKQRLNLPIVKISDTEVSISTSYNKARVIRVATQAHSFFGYINKIVTSKKFKINVVFGHITLKDKPMAYEYSTLAERYKSLSFIDPEKNEWVLYFAYNTRLEDFGEDEDKLNKFEARYGTYLGHNNKEWLFIDTENTVRGVLKQGGEDTQFKYPNIRAILRLALIPGQPFPKPLSEWCVLKTVGINLPIIFILGYKFGLRRALDMIGAKYTITERRAKTILGGNESYVLNTKNIYHSSSHQNIKELEPRHIKTPDGKDISRVFGSPYQIYSILFGDDWNDSTANLSTYSDSTDGSNPRFVFTFLKDRSYKEVSHPWSLYILDSKADWEQYAKSTTEVISYKKVKVLKEIKFNNWIKDILVFASKPKNRLEIRGLEHIKGIPQEFLDGNLESFGVDMDNTLADSFGNIDNVVSGSPAKIIHDADGEGILERHKGGEYIVANEDWYTASHAGSIYYDRMVDLRRDLLKRDHLKFHLETTQGKAFKELLEKYHDRSVEKDYDISYSDFCYARKDKFIVDAVDLSKLPDTQVKFVIEELKKGVAFINRANKDYDTIEYRLEAEDEGKYVLYGCIPQKYMPTQYINSPGMESDEVPLERKYTPQEDDIQIKFNDRILWVNRYPLKHSLIVSGLEAFDLTTYNLADFESKDVYHLILSDINKSTNYLKGVDNFFSLFIDPITFNILKEMHEPTTVEGILVRAVELLTTRDHRAAASSQNYRLRGAEQINFVIYNTLARAFADYQAQNIRKPFTVNPEEIYLKIAGNSTMLPTKTANPLQPLKDTCSLTFAGAGGRDAVSFVVEDRRFTPSDLGIMAMDTVDNQKVGMNAQLTHNSRIANLDGLFMQRPKDTKDIPPSSLLGIHTLMFPFILHDDAPRINFLSTQSVHMIPTNQVDPSRVVTGYERVIAQYCGRQFSGVAEQDGEVTGIDEKTNLIEVTYKDGSVDVFEYGEKYVEHEKVFITDNLVCNVKVGQKLKKGDIVMYDKNFFFKGPDTNQVDFSLGTQATVAFMERDINNEDATSISTSFAERMGITAVNTRVISLPKDSYIHKALKVGDEVTPTDELMIFEEDPMGGDSGLFGGRDDDETLATLSELNRNTPHAKFSGEIVKIEAFYGCELEEISSTLQPIVKAAIAPVMRKNRLAQGTLAEDDFPAATPIPQDDKYLGVKFDKETVMLVYYIKEKSNMVVGDKLVLCGQLKHTVSYVYDHDQYTDDGEPIDMVFSADAAGRRVVMSPWFLGITSRIAEELEKKAIELYFGDDDKKK